VLERTPEPELMDTAAQAEAYAAGDFAASHQAQVDAMVERVDRWLPEAPRVLDLACGPADVTVRIARALPGARIVAVDGADAMLREAAARVEREDLSARVELRRAFLPDSTLGTSSFDLVVSTSALHHFADPGVLWAAIGAAVRPGGCVFVSDLRRPERPEQVEELVTRYAAGEPPVLVDDFRNSLHAAYRPEEIAAQVAEARLPDLTIEDLDDRHVLVWGRVPEGRKIRVRPLR